MKVNTFQSVEFHVEDIKLVGKLRLPAESSNVGALLLHPHPRYGGDMNNNVVTFIDSICAELGCATFRFDFRGSQRTHTVYTGVDGAVSDAIAALNAFRTESDVPHIGIIGYSFGGSIALITAALEKPDFVVTLSASASLVREGKHGFEILESLKCPSLMFHGNSDMVVPIRDLRDLSLSAATDVECVVLENEGHFYARLIDQVGVRVRSFLRSLEF
ncbi:MAG: alpha/beta hydrolase [Candidatus Thorarchaeota archaeon]|jgi:alpha/beta superfamily hydrolase